MRHRIGAPLCAAIVVLGLAACGGSGAGGSNAAKRPDLIVSAASSLSDAFTAYGATVHDARVRLSFGGSDALAAQIRQGIRPDVFAAANTKLPAQLRAAGLVAPPVVFATNELVLAVPARGARVHALADLATPGVTIAIGSASVPVGAYTRTVLARLGAAQARAILANVRSQEPDVHGIVGKLSEGAVDAGFVYVTDVRAAGGALRAIALQPALQPRVAYGVAIVKGTRHAAAARAFVAGLLHGTGAAALRRAGFGPPPR
jgi:molybdate transport system substrate-binding protein